MSLLKLPTKYELTIDAQKKWLSILQKAQETVAEDDMQQQAAAKGMRLAGRSLPPQVVGRNYARYCDLVNKMYDAYLNNIQLQREPYILEIITVIMKRLYELRNELVHIIVNDYIYVDSALEQLHMTPMEIEIVVPYHFPLESRSENVETILQQMWVQALKRKRRRERPPKPKPSPTFVTDSQLDLVDETVEEESESLQCRDHIHGLSFSSRVIDYKTKGNGNFYNMGVSEFISAPSVHSLIPEDYIQCVIIQSHERYRQWAIRDNRSKAAARRLYYLQSNEPAPIEMRTKAALLIQKTYRQYMKIKRKKVRDHKRDILIGVSLDPFRRGLSFSEENNKMYERRKNTRLKIKKTYLEELEKQKTRLIMIRKDDIIDDITDEIREWFYEWFYNYNFFPQFPYELEGGTLLVVRGEYPTVDEQLEEDERLLKETKSKTKEQLKQEKQRAKEEAVMRALVKKETQKKDDEALLKARCDPFSDLGYKLQISDVMENLIEVLRNYRQTWSLYDELSPELFGETIYGYMKPLLVEDLMIEMHFECRKFVDELMRIDLKMLIKKHQLDYNLLGWDYPKPKHGKRPKVQKEPKILVLDDTLLKNSEDVFDLGIVTKPTTKFKDIFGDSSYAAYDYNIKDPDATFPLPGYGDIKGRLMLSCVLGCGIQPGAPKRRGVMLLGPDRNGKSFLADAVAGELNAVKIDITPEVFTAVSNRPLKVLSQVFVTARAFQPAVVFMKNVERVFVKKVPPDQRFLKATTLKRTLGKLVKSIPNEDKVIFIATCSNPWVATTQTMLSVFDEILLVPRTDYASLQQFYYKKFQSIRSMPRDFPVQPIAQLTQGFGFADIIEVFNEVMTPERIVRLNIQELSPAEFIQVFVDKRLEPLTLKDYQEYVDFFIQNSGLKKEREDYARINFVRADLYKKAAKKKRAAKS